MLSLLAVLLASPLSAGVPPSALESAVPVDPATVGFDLSANSFANSAPEDAQSADEDVWHGSFSLGMNVARGNADRNGFTVVGNATNRGEKDRKTFEFLWNYAEEDSAITQRQTYLSGKYDYFAGEKAYYLGKMSLEADKAADIQLRVITSGGVGCRIWDQPDWKFDGEAGLAYVDESYLSTSNSTDYVAARFAYLADRRASEKWTLGQGAELFPSLQDSDDITARIDTHARVTLSPMTFLQVQWLLTWDNTPANGVERTDNLLLLMLGLSL